MIFHIIRWLRAKRRRRVRDIAALSPHLLRDIGIDEALPETLVWVSRP